LTTLIYWGLLLVNNATKHHFFGIYPGKSDVDATFVIYKEVNATSEITNATSITFFGIHLVKVMLCSIILVGLPRHFSIIYVSSPVPCL